MKIKQILHKTLILIYSFFFKLRSFFWREKRTISLLAEEFFHKDLRGFGGYGATLKYLTDNFNGKSLLNFNVIITYPISEKRAEIKRYHNSKVLVIPRGRRNYILNSCDLINKIFNLHTDVFLTVDYFGTYEYILSQVPSLPIIVWNKDPRGESEWRNIFTLSLEQQALQKSFDEILRLTKNLKDSFKNLYDISKRIKRTILVVSEAEFIFQRAKNLFGLADLPFNLLRKPMYFPSLDRINFSDTPSFLFIGRLDPIKRPWIFFEIAKRFKNFKFYVAGESHFPALMDKIINKYNNLNNLIFLGKVMGEKKAEILNHVWAVVNTSIHEGLPVTFIESFSYGKPVIAC